MKGELLIAKGYNDPSSFVEAENVLIQAFSHCQSKGIRAIQLKTLLSLFKLFKITFQSKKMMDLRFPFAH